MVLGYGSGIWLGLASEIWYFDMVLGDAPGVWYWDVVLGYGTGI